MNALPIENKRKIAKLLAEGVGTRVITRIIGCSINRVTKLMIDAGMDYSRHHDEAVPNVKAKCIQYDELRSFCQSGRKDSAAV